jgi:hypothetical protein
VGGSTLAVRLTYIGIGALVYVVVVAETPSHIRRNIGRPCGPGLAREMLTGYKEAAEKATAEKNIAEDERRKAEAAEARPWLEARREEGV